MLDWQKILWCHTQVPVLYWPVLWYWLRRLAVTIELCREEGRRYMCWGLMPDGRIWIEHVDESDAERAARGALPPGFDRTPWESLAFTDATAPGLVIMRLRPAILPAGHKPARNRPATGPLPARLWPPWAGGFFKFGVCCRWSEGLRGRWCWGKI